MSKKLMREILSGTGPQTRTPILSNNSNYNRTSSTHSKNERIPVSLPQNHHSIEQHTPSPSGVALIAQKKKEEEFLRGARIRSIQRTFEEDFKQLQEVHEIEHAELDKKQQLELERLKHDRDVRINSIIRDSQQSISHMFNTIDNFQSNYVTNTNTTSSAMNATTPITSNTINLQRQLQYQQQQQYPLPNFCSADKPKSQQNHANYAYQPNQQIIWKADNIAGSAATAAPITNATKRSLSAAVHTLPASLKYDDLSDDDSVNEIFDFVDQLQNFNTISRTANQSKDRTSQNNNNSNISTSSQRSMVVVTQSEGKNTTNTQKTTSIPKKSSLTEQRSTIDSTSTNRQTRSQSLNVSWNNKENHVLMERSNSKEYSKKVQSNENREIASGSNSNKGEQLQQLLSKQGRQSNQLIQHSTKVKKQVPDENASSSNIWQIPPATQNQREPFQEIGNRLTQLQQHQLLQQQSKKQLNKQLQMGRLDNQKLTSMSSIWEKLQQVNHKSRRNQQYPNQQQQSESASSSSLQISLPSSSSSSCNDQPSNGRKYYPETTKAATAAMTAKHMKGIFERSGSHGSTISNDNNSVTQYLNRSRNNDYYGNAATIAVAMSTAAANRVDTYSSSCSQKTWNDRTLSLQLRSTDLEEY